MAFDFTNNHGGGEGDPKHDREGLNCVSAAIISMIDVNAEVNGLCPQCLASVVVFKTIFRHLKSAPVEDREGLLEYYRNGLVLLGESLVTDS